MSKVYVIGTLRNPAVPQLASRLRDLGFDAFDDWYAAGPDADDYWRDYERSRGHDLPAALKGHAAWHVFEYDRGHIDSSDLGVLLLPAGRSGHIELGYMAGRGKTTAVVLEGEPERYDVMYRFADKVFMTTEEYLEWMASLPTLKPNSSPPSTPAPSVPSGALVNIKGMYPGS